LQKFVTNYISIAHYQNVGLISVPTGRFVADASLSRRAKLPGGVRWAAWAYTM